MKIIVRLLLSISLLLSLITPLLADTIRLKDGSVIRGTVIGFKDQQFTILIGGNARGRRGQTTVYVEDVESIEFDAPLPRLDQQTSPTTHRRETIRRRARRFPSIDPTTSEPRVDTQPVSASAAPPTFFNDQGRRAR